MQYIAMLHIIAIFVFVMEKKISKAKVACQTMFLVCGIALSSWAPMVPLTKDRLKINDADLGLLLLFLGGGAIVMMPISGILSHKFGNRKVILVSGILAAISLPLLLIMPSYLTMVFAILLFGASVGTIDVAMNSQGVIVQNKYGRPIMSSLHGLFSVGGLCGSLGLGFLIKLGLNPLTAAISVGCFLVLILTWKYKNLLSKNDEDKSEIFSKTEEVASHKKSFSWIKWSVFFLGFSCFVVFLSEGAMLDWSALFLKEARGVDSDFTGIGYATFSIAMAIMRLIGDRIVAKIEGYKVVVIGGVIAVAGITIAITTPWLITTLIGFMMLGIGAANIVPVFLSEGGKLKNVSASIAIPAISTMGYAGQLAGPALLGFIAHKLSLSAALGTVAILMTVVTVAYWLKKKLRTN